MVPLESENILNVRTGVGGFVMGIGAGNTTVRIAVRGGGQG